MPRYYFHVRNSSGHLGDAEGEELPTIEAARSVAIAAIRSIISDESKTGKVDLRGRIEVTDEDGATLLLVPFSDAIEVRTGPPPSDPEGPGVLL